MANKSRSWCFTLNNYTEEERDAVRALACTYLIFGYERGDSDTPHLQGYLQLSHQKTLSAMKKMIPRAHFEMRKGTIDQAVEYCKKEGDFEEFGVKPLTPKEKGGKEKERWREIMRKAEIGDVDWLKMNEPVVAFKHMATFLSHRAPSKTIMDYTQPVNEWWYGPTGTGKSKKIWDEYPEHYQKAKNKWWCRYRGQEIVVIEEADPKTMEHLADRLKIWCDRYPFSGEIKGGSIEGIRPMKIIVTSNYSMEACFPNPNDLEPLRRRFKVTQFNKL